MLPEKFPENAIFLKVGYLEVSAFGQLAILTVFILAVVVLILRSIRSRFWVAPILGLFWRVIQRARHSPRVRPRGPADRQS
jgi:hypothetical protein